ncbi:hypothetical protein PR202_ga14055 [Eleusine coracana subsp. coracana]|uniref:protein-serine/threonine phosphatase n=1 Tax=Eleusine coracana subsp. coracana TaxID=191504 RepID=A0AAV5CGA6_ELECO|nr:hypothetical protein PR202_ga14055 [Eleusine coracana subsp. coracana]
MCREHAGPDPQAPLGVRRCLAHLACPRRPRGTPPPALRAATGSSGGATSRAATPGDVSVAVAQANQEGFLELVSCLWETQPDIATVGTCCLLGVVHNRTLFVANLGDSRAVLGRKVGRTGQIAAEQLSSEHNANQEAVRNELMAQHPDDPQIVSLKHGVWRVKGIIQKQRRAYERGKQSMRSGAARAEQRRPCTIRGGANLLLGGGDLLGGNLLSWAEGKLGHRRGWSSGRLLDDDGLLDAPLPGQAAASDGISRDSGGSSRAAAGFHARQLGFAPRHSGARLGSLGPIY